MRADKDLDDNRLSTEDIAGADRHEDAPDEARYQDMADENRYQDTPDETRSDLDTGADDPRHLRADDPQGMPNGELRDLPDDERNDMSDGENSVGTTQMGTSGLGRSNGEDAPLELFGEDEVDRFRDEWRELQTRFVDDPREAVQGADHLVAEVMKSLATTFTEHKHELEGQWQQDSSEAQTEELRLALRRYRTFFNQLLNA